MDKNKQDFFFMFREKIMILVPPSTGNNEKHVDKHESEITIVVNKRMSE